MQADTGRGTCVGLFSAKGGVGRSVLSINLAAAYSVAGRKVAVVDADFEWGGSLRELLGGETGPSLSDIVAVRHRLTRQTLQSSIHCVGGSIALLAAPTHRHSESALNSTLLRQILSYLRELFDVVILDLPSRLEPRVTTLLTAIDALVWVSLADHLSILRTTHGMRLLEWLDLQAPLVTLVFNRTTPESVSKLSILRPTREPTVLPDAPELVQRSIKARLPHVLSDPTSELAAATTKLATDIWRKTRTQRAAAIDRPTDQEIALQPWVDHVLERIEGYSADV